MSSSATGAAQRVEPELGAPLPDRRIRTKASRPPVDPRLLRFDPAVGWLLAATAALALVTAGALVVQAWALAGIIAPTFLAGASLADHTGLLRWLVAAVVVRAAATWLTDLLAQRTAARVKSRLRAAITTRLTRRPPGAEGAGTGELAALLTDGIDALDGTFGGYLPALVRGVVVPVTIVAVLLPVELTSAVILVITLPLIPIFMVLVGLAARGATRKRFRALTELSGHLLAILRGLPTIRLVGAVDRVAVQVRDAAERLRRTTLETLRIAFLSALVLELLAALAVATVAVIAGVRLAEGFGSFQPVLMALLLAPEAFWPLRQVGQQFHANEDGSAAAERLLALLEEEPASHDQDDHRPVTAPDPARVPIELRAVGVRYPGRAVPALVGIELTITPGEQVAVLGASGAGKSTLAAVLLGLRPPDEGRVLTGGVDVADLDEQAWSDRLAWVPQEPARLRGRVREVLCLGVGGEPPSDDQLHAVLAAVAMDTEVAALPGGLDCRIGPGGRGLSAGQWRRLALARALLRPVGMVVLDEPTGDLDVDAELAVRRALAELRGERTVVVCTHRLAVAADADRVVVLDHGRIVANGPPAVLADKPGAYAELVAAAAPLTPSELRPATRRAAARPEPDAVPGDRGSLGDGATSALPREGDAEVAAAPAPMAPPAAPALPAPPALPAVTGPPGWRGVAGVLRALLDPHRRTLGLAVGAGTVTPLAGLLLVAVSTYLISVTALQPNLLDLTAVIVSVRALSLLKGVSRYVERLAGHDVALRVVVDLRSLTYARLASKAPIGLAGHRLGDLLSRVVADVDRLQLALVRGVVPLFGGTLAAAAAVVVAGVLLPAAAPVLAAGLVAAGLLVPLLAWRLARRPEAALATARGELAAELVEVLDAAPELRLLGQLDTAEARLDRLDAELVRLDRSVVARGGGADAGVQLALGATAVGLVLVGVPAVTAGVLDGVLLGALVVLALAGAEAVAPLPASAQALTSAASAARRLLVVLTAADPAPEPAPDRVGSIGPAPIGLHLEAVTARYPQAAQPALHGVDLQLTPGRRVAVVGRSGAGKSTLANLAVRFLDPEQGRIRLGDVELAALPGVQIRRTVGLAEQQAHLFAGTVATNLRLALPGADRQTLQRAIDAAQLGGFVAQLPDGIDTEVGDDGNRLSGGQRHRLTLARTLVTDPPLVVLDEPTADLDAVTGRAFLRDALSAVGERGVLLLTHDLRALPVVDEVIVLEGGRVVARGRHEQLLVEDAAYAARWALDQAGTWRA